MNQMEVERTEMALGLGNFVLLNMCLQPFPREGNEQLPRYLGTVVIYKTLGLLLGM